MAEGLTTFERYLNSWRLNHPDFGDVNRTVFKVGTIKAFQPVPGTIPTSGALGQASAADPCWVLPMVQVTGGDWDDSIFIPLFYHPKPQYWDNPVVGYGINFAEFTRPAHLATDFDQDNKSFWKAMMSFRPGDEVIVMLQAPAGGGDLKPVAVMGFADGVPRIGEDIVKWSLGGVTGYLQMSLQAKYAAGDTGPDGQPLKLVLPCKIVPLPGSGLLSQPPPGQPAWQLERVVYSPGTSVYYISLGPPDEPDVTEEYDMWTYSKATFQYYNFIALIPVAPFIYCFPFSVNRFVVNSYWMGKYEVGTIENPPWGASPPNPPGPPFTSDCSPEPWHNLNTMMAPEAPGEYIVPGSTPPDGATPVAWATIPNPPPEMVNAIAAGAKGRSFETGLEPDNLIVVTGPDPFPMTSYSAFSGNTFLPGWALINDASGQPLPLCGVTQYKEELMTDPLSGVWQPLDIDLTDLFAAFTGLTSAQAEAMIGNPESMLKFFVRPHTKVELQTADMWPKAV